MPYRMRVWTGPTLVKELAAKLREAGVVVICEGTEHVYLDAEGTDAEAAAWNVLASLFGHHGTDFGLHPELLFAVTR